MKKFDKQFEEWLEKTSIELEATRVPEKITKAEEPDITSEELEAMTQEELDAIFGDDEEEEDKLP